MAETGPTTTTFSRQLLATLALVVALVAVYLQRDADPDLFGHLRYGQFFAENGPGDHADPFAYTSGGQHWQAHEWLAQWLLWQAYALAGPTGLLLMKFLVGGVALWFLYRAIRLGSADAHLWAPVFILAAVLLGRWYTFRPQLFTYALFAYFTFVLLRYLTCHGRETMTQREDLIPSPPVGEGEESHALWQDLPTLPPLIWTLPPLAAVWANLHGGFLAGLGVIGLALGLRLVQTFFRGLYRPRELLLSLAPLTLVLLLSIAATLLNPFGLDLWRYVVTEMTHSTNRLYNDEWMPLLRFDRHYWTIITTFMLLAALAAAGVFAQFARARVADIPAWVWLLSCVPLTWMAFGAIRHVPILTLWAGPVLGLLAGAAATRWRESPVWRLSWACLATFAVVPAFFAFEYTAAHPAPRISVDERLYPCAAVQFLRANHLGGNVYVALEWGSYVTWELYPSVLVSMDGRNVTLFPSSMVSENFAYYLYENQDPDVPRKYATDYLLLPVNAPVVQALRGDAHWRILHEDKVAILLVRADDRHVNVLRRLQAGELVAPDESACSPWLE